MILVNNYNLTSQDASSPLLLATFTPSISGEYFATVNLSALAGTGIYRVVSTRQIGGVGAIYQSATASIGVSAGITTLTISTIPTPLLAGDVLKIYAQGLAGDTAIDLVVEIFRSDSVNEIQAGLATTAHVQEVENKVDAVDVTTVASMGKIDVLDVKVSAIDTDSVMNAVVDGAYTFEQVVQIMAAALAGKLSRAANTLTFRDLSDTLDRIVAETDVNKQRTDMTYTV